jgi:phosphate uptake regulator
MFRELISIFRSSDPLRELGEQFSEMLRIAHELTLKAGTIIFEGQSSPEDRAWIYEQDVKVNVLERQIREQVLAHLSLTKNAMDLPYSLLLMSLVKDVERIGDYSKNLAEISDFHPGPLPEDEIGAELREIRVGVEEAFGHLANVFKKSDRERALELIRKGKGSAKRCEALIRKIAASDHGAATVTALTLGTRYYKRVGGHVLNILSSVVMPLHKVDYFDEESILAI